MVLVNSTSWAQDNLNALSEVSMDTDKSSKWKKITGIPVFDVKIHSDGCSGGMSHLYSKFKPLHRKYGNTLHWRICCEIHDKAYYYGGSKLLKKQADQQLGVCVSRISGNKVLGWMMENTVKLGGSPHLPSSYRWGYGEDFRVP